MSDKMDEAVNAMANAGLKYLKDGGQPGTTEQEEAMWAAGIAVAGDATGAMMVVAKALVGKAVGEGRWTI